MKKTFCVLLAFLMLLPFCPVNSAVASLSDASLAFDGGGLVTLYGHCSQLIARVGRTVQAGDVIALSGSTGRSTGPHLHFEMRVNGQRTNPRSYLP